MHNHNDDISSFHFELENCAVQGSSAILALVESYEMLEHLREDHQDQLPALMLKVKDAGCADLFLSSIGLFEHETCIRPLIFT